jgi:hypothetical protein
MPARLSRCVIKIRTGHGASRYEIGSGNGVLTVSGDDGKTIVYGPVAWLRVEAHSDAPTMT